MNCELKIMIRGLFRNHICHLSFIIYHLAKRFRERINIQKWAYKYAVELSFSKSATFSLQKFPFQLLKVPLLECESGTFGKPILTH